ncbi:nicotinate phosphoribosyltransferase, partial [Ligilactobacillus saerimneri]|nr:nicotinate phosphoribosyltransferase [Ligilactobacillus saerimneri]
LFGARAAIIGGAVATSNVLAGKKFDIPVSGTMAHSWIEAFDSEIDAFNAWADIYPDNCSLLVDTYDILNSGVPNAIKTFQRLKEEGHSSFG